MSDFLADHDMAAPLDGRARRRIVWGAVDPGSARIGVAAASGEPGALEVTMVPVVVPVGRKVMFDKPVTKISRAGKPYQVDHERIVEDADVDRASTVVIAHLLMAKVTHLAIERVENPYLPQSGGQIAKHLILADRVATTVRLAALREGIEVVTVQAATWRARIRKMMKAEEPKSQLASESPAWARGIALGNALRARIAGWPPNASDEHGDARDAGGILLWQALPPIEGAAKRDPGQPRQRARYEGPSRRDIQRKADAAAARVASGCTCGPRRGRHGKDCPLATVTPQEASDAKIVAKASADACACSTRCSFLGPECPGRRSARRAKENH